MIVHSESSALNFRVCNMTISWADIVQQYHHDDRRAWADIVDDDEDEDNGPVVVPEHPRSWVTVVVGNRAAAVPASSSAFAAVAVKSSSADPDVVVSSSSAVVVSSNSADVVVPKRSWVAVVGKPATDVVVNSSSDDDSSSSDDDDDVRFGDPVGLHAVQSILMSATQKNLSHFHTAGMKTTVSARLTPTPAEAMNAEYSNNTSMTFQSSDDVYDLRKQLVGAKISSFMVNVGSSLTGLDDRENVWYEAADTKMYDGTVLRIYVDYNKMRDHGLTLESMAHAAFGSGTNTSPDFMGIIDVSVPDDYISQWLAKTDNLVCGTLRIRSCDKMIDNVTAITEGTDILAVSRIRNVKNITSNNVLEVESHFGIEAAAAVLETLTGSHVVSDFMARTGKILSFVKSSVEVRQKGMLTSMGFEKPKEDIKKKCAPTTSVYESIMTGVDPTEMFNVIASKIGL